MTRKEFEKLKIRDFANGAVRDEISLVFKERDELASQLSIDSAVDDIAWLRNVCEVQSSQLRESARAFGQILSFLRGAEEEVLNDAGGVNGYRAFLDTGMTAFLRGLADRQERKINDVLQHNKSV